VRTADGPPQRIKGKGRQHLPGNEAWFIGEHRTSGEKKYYLANLPAKTDLRTLAATINARWICEQAHQQLNSGLITSRDDPGKASHDRLRIPPASPSRTSGAEKKKQRSTASAELAGRTPRHRRSHSSTANSAMSSLQKTNHRKAAA
jgi:hypothetical protein